MAKANEKRLPALAISLAVIVITLALNYSGALMPLENISYDWRMKSFRSNSVAADDIAVVLIDDASIEAMSDLVGRWPWPRSVHADVIDFLSLGAPRAIVFDVLFTEQQAAATDEAARLSDQRLIESTAEAGNVIHAMQIHHDEADEVNKTLLNRPLPESIAKHAVSSSTLNHSDNNNFYAPMPGLSEASIGLGVVTTEPDSDGIYRHASLLHDYQGKRLPSMAGAPLYYTGDRHYLPQLDNDLLINYYAKINTYSIGGILASAQQVMEGELDNLMVDPYEFEDKIVFIGASAVGLEDLKATPLNKLTPGVMIHASVAANILSYDLLQQTPYAITTLLTIVATLLTAFLVLYPKLIYLKITAPLLIGGLYIALCFYAFGENIVMSMAPPLAAVLMTSILSSSYLLFTEGRDKRRVRNMLAQYVSPAVLNTVVDRYQDYIQAEVGAEEELSILFSDIRGFTSLSEAVPANKVVEMLNYYFSAMNEAIFDKQGTIDKFIGDAIMAFWGAPVREENHADLALQAAMDMHYRLKDVNAWLQEHEYPEIQIGIGINSGKVILGNIGSVQKLDYTIIGDNVNLASRLEGLTKPYGSTIVISEYTYNLLKEPVPSHTLDLVRVKGKSVPIRIYGIVLDLPPDEAAARAELGEAAFTAYLNRDWDKAIELYSRLPDGALKSSFVERCETYKQSPPPDEWDGVYTMTTK